MSAQFDFAEGALPQGLPQYVVTYGVRIALKHYYLLCFAKKMGDENPKKMRSELLRIQVNAFLI